MQEFQFTVRIRRSICSARLCRTSVVLATCYMWTGVAYRGSNVVGVRVCGHNSTSKPPDSRILRCSYLIRWKHSTSISPVGERARPSYPCERRYACMRVQQSFHVKRWRCWCVTEFYGDTIDLRRWFSGPGGSKMWQRGRGTDRRWCRSLHRRSTALHLY